MKLKKKYNRISEGPMSSSRCMTVPRSDRIVKLILYMRRKTKRFTFTLWSYNVRRNRLWYVWCKGLPRSMWWVPWQQVSVVYVISMSGYSMNSLGPQRCGNIFKKWNLWIHVIDWVHEHNLWYCSHVIAAEHIWCQHWFRWWLGAVRHLCQCRPRSMSPHGVAKP